jgi:eukaryotic-like serine/threonine-protein kinase
VISRTNADLSGSDSGEGRDTAHAQGLADGRNKSAPVNTVIVHFWLPTIRAAIELNRKNFATAVELLQSASAYELGQPSSQVGTPYIPSMYGGEAYLKAGQAQQAAFECQKMMDHPGIVGNSVLGALAHLQLGRAKAMSGDKESARKAYKDFLTLWKDADPDIPILQQANAEYAKLQ